MTVETSIIDRYVFVVNYLYKYDVVLVPTLIHTDLQVRCYSSSSFKASVSSCRTKYGASILPEWTDGLPQ